MPNSVHNRCYSVRHGTVDLNQSIISTRLFFTCTYLQIIQNSASAFLPNPSFLLLIVSRHISCPVCPYSLLIHEEHLHIWAVQDLHTLGWMFLCKMREKPVFSRPFSLILCCELSCQDWQSSSQSLAHGAGWLPNPQKWKQSLACEGDEVIDRFFGGFSFVLGPQNAVLRSP